MNTEIINKSLSLEIYGFSGTAINKDYAGMAFKLSGKMWEVIRSKTVKNKGKNIWVYEPDEKVFAGVELEDISANDTGLEHKNIKLSKYAYYKHIGPYSLIKRSGQNMIVELKNKGFEIGEIYIEIYGHWTKDETKLETELLLSLK